jgi:hypothetical protein
LSARVRAVAALGGGLALAYGCATLVDAGGGDDFAPNAAAGPFRDIREGELGNGRVAPYALKDDTRFMRDPSVADVDGDPATLAVVAFAATGATAFGPTDKIIRTTAEDGRSFDRATSDVLIAHPGDWEKGFVGAPSALRTASGWRLYYAAGEGVGLAESDDGVTFTRVGTGPVLGVAASGWDADAVPHSPSVVAMPDGTLRMFYAVTIAGKAELGEARSTDGVMWTRRAAPVLIPEAGGFDAGGADGPHAVHAVSPLGRAILWVYYGATDAAGKKTVMAAARDLSASADGPLVRALSPVYGTGNSLGPSEPCVVRFAGFTLLFATERAGVNSTQNYPAVAVGVAPALVTLPAPVPQ